MSIPTRLNCLAENARTSSGRKELANVRPTSYLCGIASRKISTLARACPSAFCNEDEAPLSQTGEDFGISEATLHNRLHITGICLTTSIPTKNRYETLGSSGVGSRGALRSGQCEDGRDSRV
jgi:hypothetical protein